jgi:excisionase family DNA binding protein
MVGPTTERIMKIEYDKDVDALSISFTDRPRSARTEEVSEGINLDFNKKGQLVAIEILDASRFASLESLGKFSETSHELTLAEAAKESGLEPDTLRSLIHKGRLKARKDGRDWKVELADLYSYLESRDARGGGRKRELARAS